MSTDTFFRPDPETPRPIALERLQRWRSRHTPVAAVLAGPDRAVIDYGGMSALVVDSTGEVLDSWPSPEMTLLGVDSTGRLAIFSEDFTWNHQVYDLADARWLDNAEPDLPRFLYEEDGERSWLRDLQTGDVHDLVEVRPELSPQQLTA